MIAIFDIEIYGMNHRAQRYEDISTSSCNLVILGHYQLMNIIIPYLGIWLYFVFFHGAI